ncbi:MAG: lipoyl synthase [Halobacteria archaeon]|nr:lipoyl synthase [Halobacteria archaeon]
MSKTERTGTEADKPDWLRQRWSADRDDFDGIRDALRKRDLVTVCEEASCPNIDECWSEEGTATFMIMGDTCTRGCGFCDVDTGGGDQLDPLEPAKIAGAIEEIGLDYAVITSVDRDDLPDGGAEHFARVVKAVHHLTDTLVEVLIPDFQGDTEPLKRVVDEEPAVVAHNVETVERLQEEVRDPRAGYDQSLEVLREAKRLEPDVFTKSSIMLGLGETEDEVLRTLDDLRSVGVDVVTLGQYLQPSDDHLGVEDWVPPEKFDFYEEKALEKGFRFVASGPFVRSSYRAGELFIENVIEEGGEPTRLG